MPPFWNRVQRKEKSENTSTSYHLSTTEWKKRRFVFHGKAEVSEIFPLIHMFRQSQIYIQHQGRGEVQQRVSDGQRKMLIEEVIDLQYALWVSERRFPLSCSTHIKVDNNSYIIQHNILLYAKKKNPTMRMTQNISLAQRCAFAFLHFTTQFILIKFENLRHSNHTLLNLDLISQHVMLATPVATWPPKVHSKQWAWGITALPKYMHFLSYSPL